MLDKNLCQDGNTSNITLTSLSGLSPLLGGAEWDEGDDNGDSLHASRSAEEQRGGKAWPINSVSVYLSLIPCSYDPPSSFSAVMSLGGNYGLDKDIQSYHEIRAYLISLAMA